MNSMTDLGLMIVKIMVAAFATVGLMEYMKNFIKTEKTWIYSVIMPVIALGCFLAVEYLPIGVIGGILTVGCVQLDYQVIVQGFKKIINGKVKKIAESEDKSEE